MGESIPNRGPTILAVSIVLVVLSIIFVGIRLGRRIYTRSVGSDDWLILAAVLLSIGHSINDVISVVVYGFGKHEYDLPPNLKNSHGAALGFWIAQIFYKLCVMLTKLSICLLYLRIFEGQRTFRVAVIMAMTLVSLYYTASLLATIFECSPVARSWDKSISGTCVNTVTFFYVNAAFNVATDLMIMALPVPLVMKLHLPKRQRIGLALVFLVGAFATATSVARMFTIAKAGDPDTSWSTSNSTIWSAAEINVSIICACLPILKAPLQALLPRLFGREKTGTSNSSGGRYGSNPLSATHRTHQSRYEQDGWSRIHGVTADRKTPTITTSRGDGVELDRWSGPDGKVVATVDVSDEEPVLQHEALAQRNHEIRATTDIVINYDDE